MDWNRRKSARRREYTAQFYRGNHIPFLLAALSTLLIAASNLWLTWLMQQMIDTVSGVPGVLELRFLAWLTVGTVGLIVLCKALSYGSVPRFMENAMGRYKAYAFQKLTRKRIASFSHESTAAYLSAFSNDAASVEANYLTNQFTLLTHGIKLTGSLLLMLAYSPILTAAACAFFVLPMAAALAPGKRMEAAERKVSDRNERFMATLKDCLGGFPVVKTFRAEAAIVDLFEKSDRTLERAKCEKRKCGVVISALGGVVGVTAQFGTFLVGGWLALSGRGVTPGILVIFLDLTANVINPIRELPELLAARRAALGLIDKLAAALETQTQDTGAPIPNRLDHGIELRSVSFGYEAGSEILHQISVTFEAGKRYAIVGASGSGKSTLLNLLMAGHSGYTGEIRYDGRELRTVNTEALYELVSMVQQQVFLFDASIWDNLTLFRDFPRSAVERAVRLSGLTELLEERGEGYLCGENGNGLSGGEKQRISIARSLLRNASVLLVDEATSALDARTAWQVSDAILNLEHMTRIVVTHTLEEGLLRRYDQILALKDGRIAEMGNFEELMKKKGYFYSLYTVSQT